MHSPEPLRNFWAVTSLGYQTKVFIIILCSFVAGWTISSAFGGFNGAIGGVCGALLKAKEPDVKPWDSINWRALLAAYLGVAAPKDIKPISGEIFAMQLKYAEDLQEPQKSQQIYTFSSAKMAADINSSEWHQWWIQLQLPSLLDYSPIVSMSVTLAANFQAASLLLLCAMPFTPVLRQWWLIAACIFWFSVYIAEMYAIWRQMLDPWQSFPKELEYLHKRVSGRVGTVDAR